MKSMLGIIGGMGAHAGFDLLRYAFLKYKAKRDEDFPNILFHNLPIRGMNERGIEDPKLVKLQLRGVVERMQSYGCDSILMACNTVHMFHSQLQGIYSGRLWNMVDLACSSIGKERYVGVLCSQTANDFRLFHTPLERLGKVPLSCTNDEQKWVDEAIDTVISGSHVDLRDLMQVLENLKTRGAECVILGCTELPLALKAVSTPIPTIDAGRVSIDAALAA